MQYLEIPTLSAKLYYSSGEEYLNNATIFMRNASYPLNYCTDTAQQLYYFIETQSEQYGSTGGFFRAGMLNIFANAIRVQQITRKLQTLGSNTTDDVLAKLYYTGLLLNIALVFEPPTEAGDLDIDLGEDDFFSLARRFVTTISKPQLSTEKSNKKVSKKLKQDFNSDFNNVFDFDNTDYDDDSSGRTPTGALVVL